MLISSVQQIPPLRQKILRAADRAVEQLRSLLSAGRPNIEVLSEMKHGKVGFHPLEDRPLNLIGQLTETFSWLAALSATELLYRNHPEVPAYKVNAGSSGRGSDIVSEPKGEVAAETFAQIGPFDGKLNEEINRVLRTEAKHKYVFFHSPGFAVGRHPELEREGMQVWVVEGPR